MPCSPKMNQCKASCLHRRFVMDYRSERLRQETDLIERNFGYATEIADEVRVRAENGTPIIDFRTWLKGHKRPEEDTVTTPESDLVPMQYGNKTAEEEVLGIAMRSQNAVIFVNDLGVESFIASPLNAYVAEAIIELERGGIRAHWANVETFLERKGVVPVHEGGSKYGLKAWHDNAGPAIWAQGAADDVRIHYTAYRAEQVMEWGAQAFREEIMNGPTPRGISNIHKMVEQQMQDLGIAPRPSPQLGPQEAIPALTPLPPSHINKNAPVLSSSQTRT